MIRLPRHGASLPIGIGVSCSADRQILGKITADGVFLEELETNPARFLPRSTRRHSAAPWCRSTSTGRWPRSAAPCRNTRSRRGSAYRPAHRGARHRPRQTAGTAGPRRRAPHYVKNHPIYYAGPAKTPAGYASGSFGPTTAGRMDSYVDPLMAAGGSFITLAKGNRGSEVREACRATAAFTRLDRRPGNAPRADCIRKVELSNIPNSGWRRLAHRGRRFPRLHRRRRQGQ